MKLIVAALMTTSAIVLSGPAGAVQAPVDAGAGSDPSALVGQLPVQVQKAITVSHDGNATTVTIDIVQMMQSARPMGLTVLSKPLKLVFTPAGDGTIQQTVDAPVDVTLGFDSFGPQKQTGTVTYKGISFNGIIDPKIAFYRTLTVSLASANGDLTASDTGADATVGIGAETVQLTGADAGSGLIDIKETLKLAGFSERVHVDPSKSPNPKPGPGMDIDFSMPEVSGNGSINGWKSVALKDIAAFLFANHDKTAIVAKQSEFKQHIRDLIPLLNTASAQADAKHVLIQTPYGKGEVGSVGVSMALDTASPSSSVKFGERFSAIAIDTVFMPEWGRTLVPSDVDLQFGASGFDIAGGLTKLVDAIEKQDLSQPDADKTDYKALGKEAFLPTGGVHVDLLPSSISSAAYKVNWQGGIDVQEQSAKVHMDVTATGIDDVIKVLSQVRDKGAPEAVIGLYAAKARAKPGPGGSLTWAVDVDPQGNLLVNGSPVGPKRK